MPIATGKLHSMTFTGFAVQTSNAMSLQAYCENDVKSTAATWAHKTYAYLKPLVEPIQQASGIEPYFYNPMHTPLNWGVTISGAMTTEEFNKLYMQHPKPDPSEAELDRKYYVLDERHHVK